MSTLDPNVALTELSLRQDDFSAQFSLAGDPRFWIRIDLPLSAEVKITDFQVGAQSVSTAAALLAAALRQTGAARCAGIRICDVAAADPDEAANVLESLSEVIDTYVALERRFIESRHTAERGGKLDLSVSFAGTPK